MTHFDPDALSARTAQLCRRAACMLPAETAMAIECAAEAEPLPEARQALEGMLAECFAAGLGGTPLVPGEAPVLLVQAGADVFPAGEALRGALERGAAQAGLPDAVIRLLPARTGLRITAVFPGTSESACAPDAASFAVEAVRRACEVLCPPVVVGTGFGESREESELAALFALASPIDEAPDGPLLQRLRALGIGAAREGGAYTALGANSRGAGPWCTVCVSGWQARHAAAEL